MNTQNFIEENRNAFGSSTPQILDFSLPDHAAVLEALISGNRIQFVVDDYEEQQRELFALHNPSQAYSPDFGGMFQKFYASLQEKTPLWKHGRWVFYPWLSKVVHILPEEDFVLVRTSRNKYLINPEEQSKFYNAVIGIGGLSVGSSVAIAIVLQGGAKHIKLSDMDRLALSNTNRIRTGVDNLGLLKTEMIARQIYEINPYAEVELFSDGITPATIEDFVVGKKKLDIIIDEMDNLAIKYLLREKAKKYRLPIVMAADNGDNGVVDIERYDLDEDTPFFHGRMGDVSYEELSKLDKFGIGKMITKHVGTENVTERMQQSLLEMGKTVVSWPQLAGAALVNGSAVAYCVRKIANGQPLESNRGIINMDSIFQPDYDAPAQIERRKGVAETFKKIFKL